MCIQHVASPVMQFEHAMTSIHSTRYLRRSAMGTPMNIEPIAFIVSEKSLK